MPTIIEDDFYALVPLHLQKQLCAFLRRGTHPLDPQLTAELTGAAKLNGQLQLSGECPPPLSSIAGCKPTGVTAFLDKHADRFDVAHGHPGYYMRWMMRGGEDGRADGLLALAASLALALALTHFECCCPSHWVC